MALTFFQDLKNRKQSLAKSLGFTLKLKIPASLVKKIINSKVGTVIDNPVKRGRRKIKITILLKNNARSTVQYYKVLERMKKQKSKNKKARGKKVSFKNKRKNGSRRK